MILQVIILYLSFAVVDVLDKFLLSGRKIRPLSYTFFTVVTGLLLLLAWPWVFEPLPAKFLWLNLLSGAYFGLVMYVYFKVLSLGEVSRVVPVVFGLVPVFDVLLGFFIGGQPLLPRELTALCLLIPGTLLIAYYPGKGLLHHFGLKVLAAFLFSSYNWLWQYGAQMGGSLNNLMWNRIGAAVVLIFLLVLPFARKNIFKVGHVPKRRHTGWLFLLKQALGGLNFVILSYFLAAGSVLLVDGLSGFRYVFLFIIALVLSRFHSHVLDEQIDRHTTKLKFIAIVLMFFGTLILFA